ncbi:MAG: phosphoglucosamine mutase [Lachnospira sp.]|nr:phosphoglucosamine mutase [Lachnospira sp.]MDD5828527.1 phosphoglucosamine mutase [Lachnospira sp.]
MGKYFGTDGFRGEANVNLTVDHAFKVGRFLGWFYGKNHEDGKAKVVIGKDTRRSSYMFEYSLVAGLTASGADVYLLHVTTTPSVSYVARTEDFDCGIMISASHNPFYDNGIKLINDKGEKMREDVINEIEKYLDGDMGELPYATKEKIGCTVDYAAGRNRYMGYLMSLAIYSFKGIRVGLDASNGSAWTLAKSVFDALGAKTYVINAEPNGLNINDKCGSTHMESLQELVKREHLDVGFAFDGDADRCLCVDENGNIVTGDHILYIYGCYMKDRDKLIGNKVVTTVMSNFGLYKAFDAVGIDYEKTKVGDKYVYECMSENGYRIGGEQSGHIIFSKYATTGDGLITALKMMEVMIAKKKTLSQLAAPLVIYPQVLKNIRVTDKTEAQNDADVKAAVAAVADKLGSNGRILVRESGTEPVVRVMVEADSTETCEKYVDEVIEVIKNKGYGI